MLTRSLVRRALLGAGLAAFGSSTAALAQDTLKYKWNKGDVIHYRSTQESVAKMTVMGMAQTTTQQQEWVQRFEVKDVGADGVATVDMSVVSVKLSQEQDTGAKAVFDSTKPADKQYEGAPKLKPQLESMGTMVGEHLTLTIDGAGSVRKVEGMAKIVDKMLAKMGNVNPMVSKGLRSTMGDEQMRGNLERYFKVLPSGDKAAKAGETWNNSYEQTIPGAGGRMKVDSAWTLADAGKMTAQLKIEVAPAKEGDDPAVPMKTSLTDGKGDSEASFDAKAGQLVKSVTNMTLPITNTMGGGDGKSVAIKNDTTLKVVFERIPAPAAAAPAATPTKDDSKPAGQ